MRPWLYPIWRWLQVTTGREESTSEEVLAKMRLSQYPIHPIARADFDAMVKEFPYYRNRWGYMSTALLEAARLITTDDISSALELGAPVRPILVGAQVMDKTKRPGTTTRSRPPRTTPRTSRGRFRTRRSTCSWRCRCSST